MDYLTGSERKNNTTRRDQGNAVVQCCRLRPQRVPTMYTLINGGQGPHTIPFGLLHEHFQNCTEDQMDALVLKPSKFRQMMDEEEIFDYEADLNEYKKIYKAYKRARRNGKAIGTPTRVGAWGEYGWRQLGEMLVNRSPYATYHWRKKINPRTKKGRALLAGKGTERSAINKFRANNGRIDSKTALDAIDISPDHDFLRLERLHDYLNNVLGQMVNPEDEDILEKKIQSMG